MRNRTASAVGLLLLCVLPVALSVRSAAASSPLASLPAGSWWRLSYTDHTEVAGLGAFAGKYVDSSKGSRVLTVLGNDGTTLTLKRHWEGWQDNSTAQWSYWIQYNGGGPTYSGSGTLPDQTYTIDIATLDVRAINGTANSGFSTNYMTQTSGLTIGSTIPYSWTDASGRSVEVHYELGEFRTMQIDGMSVQVAAFSYTGETIGTVKAGNMNDTGPETDTSIFDTYYGLLIGYTMSGAYSFSNGGGSFTENYTYDEHTTGTNIQFSSQTTTTQQTSTAQSGLQQSLTASNTNTFATSLVMSLVMGAVIAVVLSAVVTLFITKRRGTNKKGQEQQKPRRCKRCQSELPEAAVFCDECGTKAT